MEVSNEEQRNIRLEALRLAVTLAVTNKQTKGPDINVYKVARDMAELVLVG